MDIVAVFIGKDGSEGYETNGEYRLKFDTASSNRYPGCGNDQIEIWKMNPSYSQGTNPVRYDSILKFLENWKVIKG